VAVVDREPVYRAGEAAILGTAGYPVEQVPIGSCVQRAARGDLQGLVLDDSVSVTARVLAAIQASGARPPVVLVVDQVRPPNLVAAMEAGVRSLVHRRCSADELLAAVQAAQEGRNWVSSPLAGPLREELLTDASAAADALTRREHEVLVVLATGATNAAIGQRLGISEHTVRNHVRAITTKLGAANRTDAVTTASRRGLVEL
jgi:DNA-binding NarL/FixJ family response regulator